MSTSIPTKPPSVAAQVTAPGFLPKRLWLLTFIVGAVLWALVAVLIFITENTILAPNLILLGTFLVPVCCVLFVLSRPRPETYLSIQAIVLGFLAGGTAGVMLTGTVEVYVLPEAVFTNTAIGLIEESGKGLLVILIAAMVPRRIPRDGMVLGAVVGAGFAAFESAGYALGELIADEPRHPVVRVLETEITRAVFAPFGHIIWTAIMGGALFASAWHSGRFQLTKRVALAFVGVVALHAAWDASYGVAIRLSVGLGGGGWNFGWPNTAAWAGVPAGAELWRFQILYDAMLIVLAAIGTAWAIHCWRIYHIRRWAAAHPAP